nr:immunoglobulin light chain junction region [Macaca mulatta]
CQQGHSNPFTF